MRHLRQRLRLVDLHLFGRIESVQQRDKTIEIVVAASRLARRPENHGVSIVPPFRSLRRLDPLASPERGVCAIQRSLSPSTIAPTGRNASAARSEDLFRMRLDLTFRQTMVLLVFALLLPDIVRQQYDVSTRAYLTTEVQDYQSGKDGRPFRNPAETHVRFFDRRKQFLAKAESVSSWRSIQIRLSGLVTSPTRMLRATHPA